MKGKRVRKILKWMGGIIGLTVVLTVALTLLLRFVPIYLTPLMLRRAVGGEQVFEHTWVPLSEIHPHLVCAVTASEDDLLRGHHGFSVVCIETAIEERESGKRSRGGSTISQQTAKNVFTFGTRTWVRKGIETYYTVLIELLWGKERIMEVYLNSIEMGPGIYGAEAASQVYFGRPASQLTVHQSALLAACLPDPLHRKPYAPSSYIRRRAGQIEQLMRMEGPQKFDSESLDKARERYRKYQESKRYQRAKKKMIQKIE